MGRDRDEDDRYEEYMSDYSAERDELLEAFGLFWASFARLLQAAGMVVIDHLRLPDKKTVFFRNHFLEELSLTRAASLIRAIMEENHLPGSRTIPAEMRRLNDYRNRLAHDALDFGLDPRLDVWPALRQRFPFRGGEPKDVSAEELRQQIALCEELEDAMLKLLRDASSGRGN